MNLISNSNRNAKNVLPDQLSRVKHNYFYNLGLGIIDVLALAEKDFKEAKKDFKEAKKDFNEEEKDLKSSKRNLSKKKNKLNKLQLIEKEKKEIQLYKQQQTFIFNAEKETFCQSCNNCGKANCEPCCIKFYQYILLYGNTTDSEYNRKIKFIFNLLDKHIENIRKKYDLICSNKQGKFKGMIDKKTKFIDYLIFLQESKKQAALQKEFYFPTYISNIAFLEVKFSPLGLTSQKEIVDPLFNYIGNIFMGNDNSKHSNTNLRNFLIYYKKEIQQILIVSEDQLSTNTSKVITAENFAEELQNPKNASILQDKEKLIELIIENFPVVSFQLGRKKPNSRFVGLYKTYSHSPTQNFSFANATDHLNFKTAADIRQIFPDTSLSGALLFRLYDLNPNPKNLDLIPNSELHEFINHFSYNDDCLTKLSHNMTNVPLKYENLNHVFSFHGFGIYHSYLALNSILTKMKSNYNVKNQFNFLQLTDLTQTGNGINFIKFALFRYLVVLTNEITENIKTETNENQIIHHELLVTELKESIDLCVEKIRNKEKKTTFSFFCFVTKTGNKKRNYQSIGETAISMEMEVAAFHEMQRLATQLHFNDENYKLIALRFSELLIHFDYSSLSFKKLFQKKKKKKDDVSTSQNDVENDVDQNKYNLILKKMQDIIVKEICTFIICEAALITQVRWITEYQIEKCKDEKKNKNQLIHTINFQSDLQTGLQSDLSNHQYLQESIFAFPARKKDPDCKLLENVIENNIDMVESEGMKQEQSITIASMTPQPQPQTQKTTPITKTNQTQSGKSPIVRSRSTSTQEN